MQCVIYKTKIERERENKKRTKKLRKKLMK